ncbi:MAG: Arginine--tRNA ligase [Myxococcota bacterium]|nr:Arginine--tRNA ligase [Myxococcota bacterium]
MKAQLQSLVLQALQSLRASGQWSLPDPLPAISIELPKQKEHGDYATTVCMALAKSMRVNPRALAQAVADAFPGKGLFQSIEIAGPGFLNFRLKPAAWHLVVEDILRQGERFGAASPAQADKIMVEYVSANPTGPLHVGHGRGAVVGDVIATLLQWAGHDVTREFYVNDAGAQIQNLGASIHARYRELLGLPFEIPEDGYKGDYLIPLARELQSKHGADKAEATPETIAEFARFGARRLLDRINDDLLALGVRMDSYSSEQAMVEAGGVENALQTLRGSGFIYPHDGAEWFKSKELGDEKDRVVVRSDGRTTYLASDIAYHKNKLDRGYTRLINIWGADHHGYIARVKAAVAALGLDPGRLQVVLTQMVNVVRQVVDENGQVHAEAVKSSKREGNFVVLREVIDEAGRDATRFFFVMRSAASQLDFDVELARKQSNDNPVFYVQYGHARVCSILRKAEEDGIPIPPASPEALAPLVHEDELNLIQLIGSLPEVIQNCAARLEPHHLVFFLDQTVAAFHAWYQKGAADPSLRVLCEDRTAAGARLLLASAIRQALANGLTVLGVSAPERM